MILAAAYAALFFSLRHGGLWDLERANWLFLYGTLKLVKRGQQE